MINDVVLLKLNCCKQYKYGTDDKTRILLIVSYLYCVVKLFGTLMVWPLFRLTQFSYWLTITVFDT